MQARLKVLHDKANVKQVKLLPVTLIGRSTECNLKIASSQVSRAHCRITLGEDTVYVEDLGSANGTLVNGKLLVAHQPTSVVPGATLVVGPAEFLIDYVASTSATMVLSRMSAPILPSLSSTELLLPTKQDSPAPAEAAVASPTVPPVAVAVVPVAKPVVSTPTAAPVLAARAQTAPIAVAKTATPVAAMATPIPTAAVAPPPVAVPESAPVELTFAGFAPSVDEPVADETTQFMFGEPVAFGDSSSSADSQTASSGDKKGGLKSLFSLFGCKAKGSSESASSATTPAANAPSVFLPTMNQDEAEANLSDTDSGPAAFDFGEPAAVESTTKTVTFEQPQATGVPAPVEAPADAEDDFQQFLKQF